LEWALKHDHANTALKIVRHLARFWYLHGYLSEGRDWLRRALDQTHSQVATEDRARALQGLCWLWNEDPNEISAYEESLALCRQIGDTWGAAFALRGLGYRGDVADSLEMLSVAAALQGDYATARDLGQQSLQLWREVGSKRGMTGVLDTLASNTYEAGHLNEAEQLWQECLRLARETDFKTNIWASYHGLGDVALARGELEQAVIYFEQALAGHREGKETLYIAGGALSLGRALLAQGDLQRGHSLLTEALQLRYGLSLQRGIAQTLEALAGLAAVSEDWSRAATLLGYADALHKRIGVPVSQVDAPGVTQRISAAQTHLGDAAFEQATAAGAKMSLDDVMRWGLGPEVLRAS